MWLFHTLLSSVVSSCVRSQVWVCVWLCSSVVFRAVWMLCLFLSAQPPVSASVRLTSMHTHLFSGVLTVTVRRSRRWRRWDVSCKPVKGFTPSNTLLLDRTVSSFTLNIIYVSFVRHLKWIRGSQSSGSCDHKQWAEVDQSDQEGSPVYRTEDSPNNPSVVLLTLMVWWMLYCTFASGHSAATLSCNVYCTLWYLCIGKVKYISRAEFGFYATCWSVVFPVIKSNKYKNGKQIWPGKCYLYTENSRSTLRDVDYRHLGIWGQSAVTDFVSWTQHCHFHHKLKDFMNWIFDCMTHDVYLKRKIICEKIETSLSL